MRLRRLLPLFFAWYFVILPSHASKGAAVVVGPFPTWTVCAAFANGALWEGARLLSRSATGGGVPTMHPCWSDTGEDPRATHPTATATTP